MKLLTITSLFPNHVDPKHGIFIDARLRQLRARYPQVQQVVVAPVPWFPVGHRWFGRYGRFARVATEEFRDGIRVLHPRYLVIPKIGMWLTPLLMAITLWRTVRRLRRQGFEPDLIDGHYFYPDGVAIGLASRLLKLPFVVTARGSDINLIARQWLPGKMIAWCCRQAAHRITVCQALKERLAPLCGGRPITVLPNGVDSRRFTLTEERQQPALKRALGLKGEILLSVGNLVPLKGHHLAIDALADLPGMQLVILGEGPERDALAARAAERGVADRLLMPGALPQAELVRYYGAASCLLLLSSREGMANVLLESMACGTPVVATRVGGTPEVVSAEAAGVLVEREVTAIVAGISQLLAQLPARQATRRHALQFDWRATSDGQYQLFTRLAADQAPPVAIAADCEEQP